MFTRAQEFLARNLRKIEGTPQQVMETVRAMLNAEIALSRDEGAGAEYLQQWEDALLMLETLGPERALKELNWGRRVQVGVGPSLKD
jgi:hypothetical protein